MAQRCLWRGALVIVLSLALATPARAEVNNAVKILIGIAAGATATAVLVTTLIVHHKPKNKWITGCVISLQNGMAVVAEQDRQTYSLLGNTTGIKPGNRVSLQGKRSPSRDSDKRLAWEVTKLTRDFGICQAEP
jgi:hypothetical protein